MHQGGTPVSLAGKANSARRSITRCVTGSRRVLAVIGPSPWTPRKLTSYAELYLDVLQSQRMCLCGMLAAEFQTLPEPMRSSVVQFIRRVAVKGLGPRPQGGHASFHGINA